MANIDHIMPKPVVVFILWGHDYVANPATANTLQQMVSDLVTGSFMNGLAQYGIQRGSVMLVTIDDKSPPATITYKDSNGQWTDEITKRLTGWISAGSVPAPPSPTDINQLYLILPPPETTFETYNGPKDPIGNGIQGWHNTGVTNPAPPPNYYWAIVKTGDVGAPASSTQAFVKGVAGNVGHELVEQFVDRNYSFEEIGDPCNNNYFTYRGWSVQQYHSDWDNACINGDNPVSLKQFLTAIKFDFQKSGLRSL